MGVQMIYHKLLDRMTLCAAAVRCHNIVDNRHNLRIPWHLSGVGQALSTKKNPSLQSNPAIRSA
jgi:hypothetical protein